MWEWRIYTAIYCILAWVLWMQTIIQQEDVWEWRIYILPPTALFIFGHLLSRSVCATCSVYIFDGNVINAVACAFLNFRLKSVDLRDCAWGFNSARTRLFLWCIRKPCLLNTDIMLCGRSHKVRSSDWACRTAFWTATKFGRKVDLRSIIG